MNRTEIFKFFLKSQKNSYVSFHEKCKYLISQKNTFEIFFPCWGVYVKKILILLKNILKANNYNIVPIKACLHFIVFYVLYDYSFYCLKYVLKTIVNLYNIQE